MLKYSLLRELVVDSGVATHSELHVPSPVTDDQLRRVHDPEYLRRVVSGRLSPCEIRRIGFPWSPELVERSRRSAGGTLAACRASMEDGVAVNLAGGTHHASRTRGEGFCVFNDCAVAARAMQFEERANRVAVVDCDVHQGNGTAEIFTDDPSVFTASVHGANNFPFRKARSDVDIELRDGAGDEEYLHAVEQVLRAALRDGCPDLVIYVSGADPFVGDGLGRLSVSRAGLAERDRLVFGTLSEAGVPVAAVMAGGYAPDVEDTVAIHLGTVRAAAISAASWKAAAHAESAV